MSDDPQVLRSIRLTLHHLRLSGIPFMQVEARDRDDRSTAHAELRFSLMEQTPRIPSSQMFFIDSLTGEVSLTEEGGSEVTYCRSVSSSSSQPICAAALPQLLAGAR